MLLVICPFINLSLSPVQSAGFSLSISVCGLEKMMEAKTFDHVDDEGFSCLDQSGNPGSCS